MARANPRLQKRQREKKKAERRREKARRKAERQAERGVRPEGEEEVVDVDPDIAGIVPGPQPLPEEYGEVDDSAAEVPKDAEVSTDAAR